MNEFRRMMQRVLKNNWQEQWVSCMLVILVAGLLVSRALVSFASVGMIVPFLAGYKQASLKTGLLIAIALILLPVLISGAWSDDTTEWWNTVSVKIPLITMLLGLSATKLSRQRWLQLSWMYMTTMAIGCAWSLLQYLANPAGIQAAYLKAKVLPTLADNDYVRFSWMVATAVVLGVKCLTIPAGKRTKIMLIILLAFLVIYLHFLASKTGLVCLYACGFIYMLHHIFMQKKWKTGVGIFSLILAVAILAYYTLPTLRNRVQYIRYDFSLYSNGVFAPGYNDAARWLSIKAGYDITQQHPVTGVGFGDIRSAIHQWHQQKQPDSFAYERFLPANEWMVYGAGSGWPGVLFFTAGLLLLLYTTTAKTIFSILLTVVALIPFITDDSLEGQYGVVLLAFIAFFGQQNLTQHPMPV